MPLKAIVSGELDASLVTVTDPVALPATVGAKRTVSVAVCEGFSVAGVVIPLTEKPVPVVLTAEMCTAALPALVTTTCPLVLLPTATVPKLKLVGFALSRPVAVLEPVPLNATFSVGVVGSLLVIAMFPEALPAAVGANVTTACADCPALIVLGVVKPLMLNSLPVRVIRETVRSAEPVLLKVKLAVPVSPVETDPKLIEAGFAEICGCVLLTAVADRFTTTGELLLSPVTVIVPVTFPAAVGFTFTEKLPEFPAAKDIGRVTPDMLN